MHIIGDKKTFAVAFEFSRDPDEGRGATREESLSWGYFALWIQGKNICQFMNDTERSDAVHWYLLPMLEWLADNWGPLLYEEAPPNPIERGLSARSAFFEYGELCFCGMSERVEALWYDWGQRHSLRACSSGGIFPDLYLRGSGEKVEFSWGNSIVPGYPKTLYFTVPSDTAFVSRVTVEKVLQKFLEETCEHLVRAAPDSSRILALSEKIKYIRMQKEEHISWMIPAVSAGRIAFKHLLAKIRERLPNLEVGDSIIPAPVLMFGSCSPTINERDLDIVLRAITTGNESLDLSESVRSIPFRSDEPAYHSGYNAAQYFLDTHHGEADFVDIEIILRELSVRVVDEEFSDRTMRGIALAGNGLAPTIFVNTVHQFHTTPEGRRYTLAHEFCHLLHDRQYGREVGVVSGLWAPLRVEQRANAFAAMLLMPIDLLEHHKERFENIDFKVVQDTAETLQVSKTALIEHLHNVGFITMIERDSMIAQNNRPEDRQPIKHSSL